MSNKEQVNDTSKNRKKIECSLELESLSLDRKNIARVVPDGGITHLRFLPSNDFKMVVAGNRVGDIGFWNVGESEVFVYHPHQAPISGISIHPHCLSKIYTSCNDGFVRMMDAEKEVFDMVYHSSNDESKKKKDKGIYALSQPKNEANCLYLAEGSGYLTVWDNRIGKCSSSSRLDLHQLRINTIDFNPENPHIGVTSSSDGTACT
ncbi:putative transcription factor WD40-like family [Medicago truncatula]|uniref:Putative transcription factor WD40-like family n=2 Tax=Medicago truncatula TaxID=3880 RepID=A0A396IMG6_MEDTR|nr:putative transcription factor WD40-like family [Medicago truncatula]